MKSLWLSLLIPWCASLCPPTLTASPVVPGLSGKHPLTEAQVGQLLMVELRCFACHDPKDAPVPTERTAPDLSEVGSRVSPEYLQRFIASPSALHPGTTMPDLLASQPGDERKKIAEALTHFLIAQSSGKFARQQIDGKDTAKGKALFHTIGCVACHSPRNEDGKETITEGVVDLQHVSAKYSLNSLRAFLFQPSKVRPAGRMPDMKLSEDESRALASYLLGIADIKSTALQPKEQLVGLGNKYFQQLNCAACHQLGDIPPAKPLGGLIGADLTRGCLSKAPGKAPQFHLSANQKKAIRSALAKKATPGTDKERVAFTLTRFNCIGCHERDDYGGVRADRNSYFTSTEKELGDEGRIPPPLTLVGAKLQKLTLKKVLFDGDSVRPYQATRMPQFGEPHLSHLPDLFASLDEVKKIEFSLPKPGRKSPKERDREREMRAGGRDLIGDRGLSCISCHSFKGKTSNRQGIDLLAFTERLQPSWFYHFVRDPNAFRPRTVMPSAWPGGKALHKKILGGDTDRQIEAIWYYLSLGTSAPTPAGIDNSPTLLKVTDGARTYRGRSQVAGYRGIAVGFPEKLSYAFNAETGTLSAIWTGDFIRVNRRGQGSGNFQPAGRHVALAQDLSFYRLANDKALWPLRPVMTKESPVNPDPLYPKNRGYQFKGYYFDDNFVPTFTYRTGNVRIEDRSFAQSKNKELQLVRQLSFDSPEAQTVWFRALTGKVQAESKRQFKTPSLRLSIPTVPTMLRPMPGDAKSSELLLKLEIPKGKSIHRLTYEILP